MGTVWHATDLRLDIPCAVKFIEGDYASMPEAQARFEREAKAAAHLRSPHVVQILDHGVWQGTPYIAMELLDGEDLGKRLISIGRMSPRECCTIMTQVSRALTKAHGAGVVHRDLKPDNIFLVKDDDREIAKVLDFGIAKAKNQSLEGSTTKTGAMLGTPYYMSPEQAQGTKAVDHRSDLWSLGVIVFQALTGRLPFESEALGDLLVRIIVSPVPMPSQLVGDLPAGFDRWWQKASQRDPNMRYQSAKELADGLNLVFGNSQVTDVMERPNLAGHAPSDGAMHAGPQTTPQHMPFANTPSGQAQMPRTPPPGTLAMANGTPFPVGHTPQPGVPNTPAPYPPGMPMGAGSAQQSATTGAPIARTFGDGADVLTKSKTGVYVGIAAAAVLVLAVGGVGIAMSRSHGHAGGGAGAAAATTTAPATTAALVDPAATGTTTSTTSATAAGGDTTPAATDTASASATVAANGTATATGAPHGVAPGMAATGKATTKPTATATATHKKVDLGI
jgi:serine/threonine protein kinase